MTFPPGHLSGKVHAHLTRTSFAPDQASKVKLVYSFFGAGTSFAYVLTLKKSCKWQTVESATKKGSFKGSNTMTVNTLFAGKPIKVGSYRLKLARYRRRPPACWASRPRISTEANSVLLEFVIGLSPKCSWLPTVSGIAEQGQTLNASAGTWANSPTSFAYRWQHCDSSGVYCNDIYLRHFFRLHRDRK